MLLGCLVTVHHQSCGRVGGETCPLAVMQIITCTSTMTAYPVGISTKAVQQELIFIPEEERQHHHTQLVSPLGQLGGLGGVVEVVVGHQQRLVRADGSCIAADVGKPVEDVALFQHTGLVYS